MKENPRKFPLDASSEKEEQILANSAKSQLTILSYGIKSPGKGVATKASRDMYGTTVFFLNYDGLNFIMTQNM